MIAYSPIPVLPPTLRELLPSFPSITWHKWPWLAYQQLPLPCPRCSPTHPYPYLCWCRPAAPASVAPWVGSWEPPRNWTVGFRSGDAANLQVPPFRDCSTGCSKLGPVHVDGEHVKGKNGSRNTEIHRVDFITNVEQEYSFEKSQVSTLWPSTVAKQRHYPNEVTHVKSTTNRNFPWQCSTTTT